MSIRLVVPTIDPPLRGENKRQRLRGEVELPARFPMAGGVGEATCAACHVRSFMVVVHSRRFCRAQVPLESAVDFVAVGRKPVKGASVGVTIFAKIGRARKGSEKILPSR